MKAAELQPRQGKVDIVLDIVKKSEAREFNKFGKAGRVCNATGKDESGEITLTLWNEQVEQVNVGDRVHITNGYVSEWQGEKQLSTGKFGQLEVVGKADGIEPAEKPKKTSKEEIDDGSDYEEDADAEENEDKGDADNVDEEFIDE